MKVQQFRSVGLVALSYSMALLVGSFVPGSAQRGCVPSFQGDGDCDDINNYADCDYDGGDCCEESCISDNYICGGNAGYDCLDPDYPGMSYSFSFGCDDMTIGDGYCDPENNFADCGYDGGDCCPCTCPDCGGQEGWTCEDPAAPCLDFYIEAGTVTTVTAETNGYDARPGVASGDSGCMTDGCTAALTRDDDIEDEESRWSCKHEITSDYAKCWITFRFAEALELEYLQVAFWKADERTRSLEVRSNGQHVGTFESMADSDYTAFALSGEEVHTMTLTASGLDEVSWISLLEVRFMLNGKIYFYADGR